MNRRGNKLYPSHKDTVLNNPADSGATFPFSVEFQKSLLRLLVEDVGFGNKAIDYLRPEYFENEVLAWAFSYLVQYRQAYNSIPPLVVIFEETGKIDVSIRELYQAVLGTVFEADLSAEDWLRDKTIEFIKRNIFVEGFRESRELYNQGQVPEAYDFMMGAMDKLYHTEWEVPDRGWFFDELPQRLSERLSGDPMGEPIPTGIAEVDSVLGGGLSIGEFGIWIGLPKTGKTTILINHGVQAVRRGNHPTLHAVFEGSRRLVENRYDTIFAQCAYATVKSGDLDRETYERITYDYLQHKKKLVVRGFTERWDYTVSDITEEMRELKRLYNWKPDLVIIDYGDLLRARGKGFESETDTQRAAFRDQKSLSNRGYAVWTATQAQRPKKAVDLVPDILTSRNVADCYDKTRVADFIGSVNQTRDERAIRQMRLYLELYRDNEAGIIVPVKADFSTMTITTLRNQENAGAPSGVPLGYVTRKRQGRAPL